MGVTVLKVLIVDDDPDFLEQAEIYLHREKEFLDVETVTSAEEALELLEEENCEVIVSDYKMPQMDGIEFLKALRDRGYDIPFIMLTGKGEEEVASRAMNLGADRYLRKIKDARPQYRILTDVVIREARKK